MWPHGLLSLLAAEVAPASAVGDVAELLYVNVEHRAGMVVLVAPDGFARGAVDVREPVEVRVGQDLMDRRRCDSESTRELHWFFADAETELDTAFGRRRVGLVGRVVRMGGAVLHRLAGAVAVSPALHGQLRDLESSGDLAYRPALVNDEASDDEAMSGREGGIGLSHDVSRHSALASAPAQMRPIPTAPEREGRSRSETIANRLPTATLRERDVETMLGDPPCIARMTRA